MAKLNRITVPDTIDFFRQLVHLKVARFPEDFIIDTYRFRSPISENARSFFMTRHSGCYLFPQREVYTQGDFANAVWHHYQDTGQTVEAFAVYADLTQPSRPGTIIELDYAAHMAHVGRYALEPQTTDFGSLHPDFEREMDNRLKEVQAVCEKGTKAVEPDAYLEKLRLDQLRQWGHARADFYPIIQNPATVAAARIAPLYQLMGRGPVAVTSGDIRANDLADRKAHYAIPLEYKPDFDAWSRARLERAVKQYHAKVMKSVREMNSPSR